MLLECLPALLPRYGWVGGEGIVEWGGRLGKRRGWNGGIVALRALGD